MDPQFCLSATAVPDLLPVTAPPGTGIIPGAGPDAVPRAVLLVHAQGSE